MSTICVFAGLRSCARVHPAQPVPIIAIVFCLSSAVGATEVREEDEEEEDVGVGGEGVLASERVVTILAEIQVFDGLIGKALRSGVIDTFRENDISLVCETGEADTLSCRALNCVLTIRAFDINGYNNGK